MTKSDLFILLKDTEQFDKDPQSQNVISGSQVTFSCISGYSAPPAVISWLKNGFLFENGELELDNYGNEKNGGAFRRVSNLTFISTYDSGGNYQCLATNPLSLKVVLSSAAFLNNSSEYHHFFIRRDKFLIY